MTRFAVRLALLLPFTHFFIGSALSAQIHVRTAVFAPVELTYEQLYGIVEKSRKIADAAASGHSGYFRQESLMLSGVDVSVEIKHPFNKNDFRRAPTVIYGLEYSLRYSDSISDDIIAIDLWLSDHRRQLRVSGSDPTNVDSLFYPLKESITGYTYWLGGSVVRNWFGFGLWAFSMTLIVLSQASRGFYTKICLVALGIFIPLSLLTLPWQQWLPGAIVYEFPQSIIEEYQFAFYMIGLLAPSLLAILFEQVKGRGNRAHSEPAQPAGT